MKKQIQASDSFNENKCDSTMDTTTQRLSMSKSQVDKNFDQYGNQLKPQKLLNQISEEDLGGQNYLPSDDAREGDDFQSSTENLPKAIY